MMLFGCPGADIVSSHDLLYRYPVFGLQRSIAVIRHFGPVPVLGEKLFMVTSRLYPGVAHVVKDAALGFRFLDASTAIAQLASCWRRFIEFREDDIGGGSCYDQEQEKEQCKRSGGAAQAAFGHSHFYGGVAAGGRP